MTLAEVTAYVNEWAVPGWLHDVEGALLYEAAAEVTCPTVIELGTYCGRATCYLAAARQGANDLVYSIDRHDTVKLAGWSKTPTVADTLAKAREALSCAGLLDHVNLMVGDAEDLAGSLPPRAGLVFIDGDHTYENVLADLTLLGERVARGGLLALHDWANPGPPERPWGVQRAFDDWQALIGPRQFEDVRQARHLMVFRRTW